MPTLSDLPSSFLQVAKQLVEAYPGGYEGYLRSHERAAGLHSEGYQEAQGKVDLGVARRAEG